MRTVAPTLLASYLLLSVPHSATAAGKIKIEIVEATETMRMVPRYVPGAREQTNTHCDASVQGNTAKGDCNTTVTPATSPSSVSMPSFEFSAKAILPDGSHVALVCYPWNKNCWSIAPMAPEKSSANCDTVSNAGHTCTTRTLGVYQAKRNKNELVIYGPNGKLRYQITGAW